MSICAAKLMGVNETNKEVTMKFGIYLPNFGPFGDAKMLASLAHDAEAAGWDGFFLWDHIAGYALDMVDPWVALTAVALRTEKIRIGTTVRLRHYHAVDHGSWHERRCHWII